MNVWFRADASLQIGSGHIARCLTLASELRLRGAVCRFICREHPGNLHDLIRNKGFGIFSLPVKTATLADNALMHSHWLGATQDEDAAGCREIIASNGGQADWLVVDHYALDQQWEKQMSALVSCIMVIDDLADRVHDCDLLLDQNWHAGDMVLRYRDKVSDSTRVLTGPHYALLRPEFRRLRNERRLRDGTVRRILVFAGGSDQKQLTRRFTEVLGREPFRSVTVDIVAGGNTAGLAEIRIMAAARENLRIHEPSEYFPQMMSHADLMLGAGGGTTWERLCIGLPSLVVSVADNQTSHSQALADAGYCAFAGEIAHISDDDIASLLQQMISNPVLLAAQSRKGRLLVDGLGVQRVADCLTELCGDS